MRTIRLTRKTLAAGLGELAARDTDIARALGEVGPPALRRRRPGFEALLRAIVAQQVSLASAAAIWGRLEDAAGPPTPQGFLTLDDAALRRIGFSRQKTAYGRGLAEDIVSGRIDLEGLPRLADEEAIAELIKIKGIGRWSAEIYLLMALGRPDIWPADDLALMIAAGRLKRLETRPGRPKMLEIGEAWRPWRGVAAHVLWHYYRNGGAEVLSG